MEEKKAKGRPALRAALIVLGLFVALFLYYFASSLFLHVVHYTVRADLTRPIRIVQLTDLHNSQFGENNSKLVALVDEQDPDLIVMTGDMLNRDDPNTEIVEQLIRDLVPIAPVYFGYGNHETSWEANYLRDLHEVFSAAGAIVLESEYADIEIKGQALRIGGYMGYWWQPHMMTSDPGQKEREYQFFHDFADTDRQMILLNHIPTSWLDWHYINTARAGIAFCGHYHGGVIRIPILDQGLFAPYVGWFPPYTKGVFEGEKTTCILSAGLGNEHHVPRFNNPPEIVVVDLLPGKNETKQ